MEKNVSKEQMNKLPYIIAVDDDENTECVWSVTRE